MLYIKPMTPTRFEEFKKDSQENYAKDLSKAGTSLEDAKKTVYEQFSRLVANGIGTTDQIFLDVFETTTNESIGYLWLGYKGLAGRRVASINDIKINPSQRGKGFGKALMRVVELEVKKAGATRIRLHVFNHNEVAKKLYLEMGFVVTDLDMHKDLA